MSAIDFTFKAVGGKLYFDYLLPTNWSSRNPIIRFLWFGKFWRQNCYPVRFRLFMCLIYGGVHIVGLVMNAIYGTFFSPSNILVNLYPVLVQIWIAERCFIIIFNKQKR